MIQREAKEKPLFIYTISDTDTKKPMFRIKKYATDEANVLEYIAERLTGEPFMTKRFMDYKTIREIGGIFKVEIKQKRIRL
jgi:hypothetical protein